jgi:type II secretory pathway pseudopilin PulG
MIMVVILAAMALVSLYSNVQRWRRSKIETVIVTPAASPSSTP